MDVEDYTMSDGLKERIKKFRGVITEVEYDEFTELMLDFAWEYTKFQNELLRQRFKAVFTHNMRELFKSNT